MIVKIDPSLLQPTPNYNNALAEDVAILIQHKIISSVSSMSNVVKQVIVLFKVWLTQRQLRYGLQSFDSHSAALLVAYLFQTKRISSSIAVITAFQILLKFVADLEISSSLNFSSSSIERDASDTLSGISLYHPIGSKEKFIEYNSFWRIHPSTWSTLIQDAKNALRAVQSFDNESTFRKLFLSRVSELDREDILFRIPISFDEAMLCSRQDDDQDLDEPFWQFVVRKMYQTVQQALSDRVVSMSLSIADDSSQGNASVSSCSQFSLSFPSASSCNDFTITIAMTLAIDKAVRKVDRGPTYEQIEELQAFRELWGSKCQLRRFQDGTIVESVVWEGYSWLHRNEVSGYSSMKGSLIVGEILRHILGSRFPSLCGPLGEKISSACLELDELQHENLLAGGSSNQGGRDHMEACKKVVESLDALRTILASKITGMPIMIESLQGIDPELRYTCLYAPSTHPLLATTSKESDRKDLHGKKLSLQIKPILILGTLESSGKWPSDSEAIRMLKSGIYLRVVDLLKEQYQLHAVVHSDSLDIMFQGYLFRLMLISDKERTYGLEYYSANIKPVIPTLHLGYLTSMSIHHQAIRNLVATFPCYADTVRCLSNWMNDSNLSGLCSHALIELLVSAVFIDPFPKSIPSTSSTVAFLQVLRLLSEHDWRNQPLILNLDQTITSENRLSINTAFQSYRQQCRSHGIMHLPLYIVPSYHRALAFKPLVWDYDLSGPELSILVKSAKAAYQMLESRLYQKESSLYDGMNNASLSMLCSATELVKTNYNLTLKFQTEISTVQTSSVGTAPSYAIIQTFKNTPMQKLSTRNMLVR
jgi:U3 small nucleolar RNA-associated protein 22